jgi:hypothetical protein
MIEAYVSKQGNTKDEGSATVRTSKRCKKCNRQIDHLEQTYTLDDDMICQECHELIHSEQSPQTTDQEEREKLEQMSKITGYLLLKKKTRPGAIGAIIFGAIALMGGIAMLSENPINCILIMIGIFLLIEGIVVLAVPSPSGIILQGIGMWMVGLWNFGLTMLEVAAGMGWSFWGILGLSQMIWGTQSFAAYKRLADGAEAASDESLTDEVEIAMKDVLKANAKSREDIITFRFGAIAWKGRLGKRYGIFTEKQGKETQFLLRDDVSFTEKGKALIGKTLKVRISLDHKEMDGIISPEHMERFTLWKSAKE